MAHQIEELVLLNTRFEWNFSVVQVTIQIWTVLPFVSYNKETKQYFILND